MIRFEVPKPPSRDFKMADLFLEADSFAEGWIVQGVKPDKACSASPLGSGCHTYGEEMRYRDIHDWYYAKETIYRYRSPVRASQDFEALVEDEFINWPDQNPWQIQSYIPLESLEAEKLHLACRTESVPLEECQVALQYQEFVIVFFVRTHKINKDIVGSLDLLDSLIIEIDTRMASYLDK